ncbi:CUE domain-containing protein 2-A-like [Lineus longissimus]|uniref:CUE domain-containing protein 2-A-like n=1 Tax=Lineus longissimus TaxID=88925 RepID=UPI00315DCFFB
MENKEEFIMRSLSAFLKKHSEEASISSIDDIVLSYMVSILEDLGTPDATEESFDVDSFSEMMDAYLPGFCNIKCIDVCEWMFELASQMSDNHREKENKPPIETRLSDILKSPPLAIVNGNDKSHTTRSRKCSGTSTTSSEICSSPLVYLEPDSPRSFKFPDGHLSDDASVDDEQVELLLDMFPTCCRIEVVHCLGEAQGDVEAAVQLLIRNEEAREGLAQSMPKKPHKVGKKKSDTSKDDKKMRDSILQKYSYVDLDDDKRTYRPPPQKTGPKKLVRYLEGKVVSTKGERFTEVKKEEEEREPKKKEAKQHKVRH